MKAIGYVRVSTEEQAKEGISLENQTERIKALCIAKDLTEQWLWTGDSGEILEDMIEDGSVNLEDFSVISENWGSPF